MFKNTFKPIDKLSNNTDIKGIKMLVNRSLGLSMSSMHDESSDFTEILSENSSDSDMFSMSQKGVSSICHSPIPRYETDLQNLMQSPCDKNSTMVNSANSIEKEKNVIQSTNYMLKNKQDVNAFEFLENNDDIVTEITKSLFEKILKDSFLCMSDNSKNTRSTKLFSEEKAQKKIENVTSTVRSKQNKRNVKHVCPHCSKCFRNPSKLKKHIRSHNLSEYEQENKSSETGLMMDKSKNWESDSSKMEIRKVKSLQECLNCSKSFKCPSKLARHIKTHTALKPYTCQFCSKGFLERFNLLAHVNIHNQEKTYDCDICQRSFNFKSNLTRHLRSHVKEKPFTCSECGDAYSSEKMLAIHVRNHEEKPHKCTECKKAFKKKSNLKRHSVIHSNERRYPCDLCDYSAKQNSHLKRHIERNHTK